MSEAYNQLLYWISAQGQGSAQNLANACQTLGLSPEAYKIRRDLQLLGHLEVQAGAQRWSINRPAWIQSARKDYYFGAGERFPVTPTEEIKIIMQEQAPDLVSCTVPASNNQIVGCTSRQLLALLPALDFWRENLVKVQLHHPLQEYQFEYWNAEKRKFIPLSGIPKISADKQKPDYEGTGVYRLKKRIQRNPMDQYSKTLYWDGSRGQKNWLVADLIGLRFAHFYDNPHDEELVFVYHPQSATLWIPEHQRWPYIYERCLILASGFLPQSDKIQNFSGLFLKYIGIPPDFITHFQSLTDVLRIEMLK